jgi:putative transferase (TIGR04331 family)
MTPNKFIALTSDRRFWDESKGISLLGSWCLKGLDEHDVYKKNIERYPIECNENGFSQFKYTIDNFYKKYLKVITKFLNIQHKTNYSERYWEIIIGPFLYKYLGIMYERHITIKNLIATHQDFHTIVLDEESYYIKGYVDTNSFLKRTQFDDHNLEIYSKLLNFFGKSYPSKKINRKSFVYQQKKWNIKLLLEFLLNSISYFKHNKKTIFLQNSYLSHVNLFYFIFLSKFRIKVKLSESDQKNGKIEINYGQRRIFGKCLPEGEVFEKFIKQSLPLDFPICYIEGYANINKMSKKSYPKNFPDIIYSANSWYYDEVFKVWAAGCLDKSILIGSQHGGNYGVTKYLFEEEFERKITDYYFTWGWRDNNDHGIIPICSFKLWNYKELKTIHSDEILFSMTIKPNFFSDIRRIPKESVSYLKNHEDFINFISKKILFKIRVRPYNTPDDNGVENLWRKYNKNVLIEGWNVKLKDSLMNCKLFICDHIMTTYLEALKMNVPTIIYFDTSYPNGILRDHVLEDFIKLKDVGILYTSASEAAIGLNKIYDNIDDWWGGELLQEARGDFCKKYANTSGCSVKKIDDFFMKITDSVHPV